MNLFDKYAQESYRNSFDHGFWEEKETLNKGEMVMLIVSELGECQEANRKNKRADYLYKEPDRWMISQNRPISVDPLDLVVFKEWFLACVKDTEGDELADVAIRIMNYLIGWNIPYNPREYRKVSLGNFSHDLLRLNWYIMLAFEEKTELHPGKDWGYALAAVEQFAKDWNIDLDWHIEQKQRFNRTRPYKHLKAY